MAIIDDNEPAFPDARPAAPTASAPEAQDRTVRVDDASSAATRRPGDLLAVGLIAPLAGAAAGLTGALFRLTLDQGNRLREALIQRTDGWGVGGLVTLVALAAAAASISAWLVRRIAPSAVGSGIPRVMAVLNDEVPPAPLRVIPVKFLAGALAMAPGLALGREGTSVQMGASIAYHTGRLFRLDFKDCRILLAAGAGAGFAAAFNAPIAGAVFVLEALVKRFETRIAMTALAASAAGVWVGRAVLGDAQDGTILKLVEPGFGTVPLYVLLGAGAGFAGVLYNRTVLASVGTASRLKALPVEFRAATIGAAVAVVAWSAPSLVGSGDVLAREALNGVGALALLPLVFLLRLCLIAGSVAAGTPGGLLVPFLALGAELGLWVGLLCVVALPGMAIQPEGFAMAGMAALFTAIVRAPLTAIVLVTEMTANMTMLLPMVVACSAAMLVPAILGDRSILLSLKERLLRPTARMGRER